MKRKIILDGIRILWLPIAILAFYETINIYLNLSIGTILGDFTEYILSFNKQNILNNMKLLLVCVIFSTLIMPLISLAGNYFLFGKALKHDRYIFNRYYSMSLEEQRKIPFGEVQYRIENDPNQFRITLVFMSKYILCILISGYGIFHVLKRIDSVMMIVVLGLAVIKWIIVNKIGKIVAESQKKEREFYTQLRNYEIDISFHLDIFLIFRWGDSAYKKIHDFVINGFQNLLTKTFWGKAVSETTDVIINSIFPVFILLAGCIEASKGKLGISHILTVLVIFPTVEKVIQMIDYCIKNRKYMKDIMDRMLFFYSNDFQGKKVLLNDMGDDAKITGENLSYKYDENAVFENLSFSITHNKTAIYGENGKGKSTLMKMLCGFIRDYKGSIYIGNQNLKGNEERWFNNYAYVSQNPYVFEGSLAENVAMTDCYNEKSVKYVVELTGINYLSDRKISNKSVSGGEKQRIALARALYSNRDWIFMDEPTNNLDTETIKWLKDFISTSEKALVFITHQKKLAEKAQTILRL